MGPLNRTVAGRAATRVLGTFEGQTRLWLRRNYRTTPDAGPKRWFEGTKPKNDRAELSIVAMPVRRQNVRTPQQPENTMAQYVVLIYENESDYANASPEVLGQVMDAHNRFAKEYASHGGKTVEGQALQATATATSIRGDVVTDGPFVETKEALGGFYLIDADDLDQAIKIAGMVPAAHGGVEVRPVMAMPQA